MIGVQYERNLVGSQCIVFPFLHGAAVVGALLWGHAERAVEPRGYHHQRAGVACGRGGC